jgi:hypothetical protein
MVIADAKALVGLVNAATDWLQKALSEARRQHNELLTYSVMRSS